MAPVVLQPAASLAVVATALVVAVERPVEEVHRVAAQRLLVDRAEVRVVLQLGVPLALVAEPEHVPRRPTPALRRTVA